MAVAETVALELPFGTLADAVRRLSPQQWEKLCRERESGRGCGRVPQERDLPVDDAEPDEWLDELEAMVAGDGHDMSVLPTREEVLAATSGIKGSMARAVREDRETRG